eukprot:TRINITY_DN942_c0_g1_i3.p1 TRINITY_DN942_c0_g1~~TRINITY_DN942_c0_g1_i3.p1  ORF type:complete len:178 (+),score=22.36 TRINITY_DN942_c0_g1_i3:304-837(+)
MDYNINTFLMGQEEPIGEDRVVRPFRTIHSIYSQGYAVCAKTKLIKPKYKNLKPEIIERLQGNGTDIYSSEEIVEFAFTGDTAIGFIKSELVRKAKILFMELTFMGPNEPRPINNHIHLDDVYDNMDAFEQNDLLVFYHFARRYSTSLIVNTIQEKFPQKLRNKIFLALDGRDSHCF